MPWTKRHQRDVRVVFVLVLVLVLVLGVLVVKMIVMSILAHEIGWVPRVRPYEMDDPIAVPPPPHVVHPKW